MNHDQMRDDVLHRIDRIRPKLATGLVEALDVANDWRQPATSSQNGPGSKGTVSSPTEAAAVQAVEYGRTIEAVLYQRLTSALETMHDTCDDLERYLGACCHPDRKEARRIYNEHTGTTENRAVDCDQIHCKDAADAGSPFCTPCRDYIAERPDTRVVPRSVIDGRIRTRKSREQTRIHVTGPLAGKEAS